MIYWIIIVLQLTIIIADIAWYYSKFKYSTRSATCKTLFAAWCVLSDILPLVISLAGTRLSDNSTVFMTFAMWTFYSWLILTMPRGAYYLFALLRLPRVGLAVGIGIVALFIWGATDGRTRLRVNRVEISSERLPHSFDGFRIVQFTDTHLGTLVRPHKELQHVVEAINTLHPDLIVFCGDLINVRYTELDERIRHILSGLRAPHGVVSVIGNHDLGVYVKDSLALPPAENLSRLIALEEQMGWRVLEDTTKYIRRGSDSISLSGIGFSPMLRELRHASILPNIDLGHVYDNVPDSLFNITVSHMPQLWPQILAQGYGDLTLAGHVHSLQMKLSIGGLRFSPAQWLYERWSGRYDSDDGRTLYINDGIGYVLYPMRLGASPEITLFTLAR